VSRSLVEQALDEASPDPKVLKKINDLISDMNGSYHGATQEIMRIKDPDVQRETKKLLLTMLKQKQMDLKTWVKETERGLAKMR